MAKQMIVKRKAQEGLRVSVCGPGGAGGRSEMPTRGCWSKGVALEWPMIKRSGPGGADGQSERPRRG